MFDEINQKEKTREDAIYNPIEGKWEKRKSKWKNKNTLSIRHNKLEMVDIKNKIDDLKENAIKLSSAPAVESSVNIVKKMIDIPMKGLKDIKRQQDLHDQKYFQVSEEEESQTDNTDEGRFVINIVIAFILFLLAVFRN